MPLYPIWFHDKVTPKPEAPIFYEVSANGAFLHKATPFWKAVVPVRRIAILEAQQPSFELLLPPIPKRIVLHVARFFAWVTKEHGTEALALLWWSAAGNGAYAVTVPPQQASSRSLRYDIPDKPGYCLIGTLHSHGPLSAFHSCQDLADERHFDGLHATLGSFHSSAWACRHTFSVSLEAAINGMRFPLDVTKCMAGLTCSSGPGIRSVLMPGPQENAVRASAAVSEQHRRDHAWREQYESEGHSRIAPRPYPQSHPETEEIAYALANTGELLPTGYKPPLRWVECMQFFRFWNISGGKPREPRLQSPEERIV